MLTPPPQAKGASHPLTTPQRGGITRARRPAGREEAATSSASPHSGAGSPGGSTTQPRVPRLQLPACSRSRASPPGRGEDREGRSVPRGAGRGGGALPRPGAGSAARPRPRRPAELFSARCWAWACPRRTEPPAPLPARRSHGSGALSSPPARRGCCSCRRPRLRGR